MSQPSEFIPEPIFDLFPDDNEPSAASHVGNANQEVKHPSEMEQRANLNLQFDPVSGLWSYPDSKRN